MVDFVFPDLETERLVLRRWQPQDVDFAFAHFSNPKVYAYLYDEDPVTRREQAEEIVNFYLEQDGRGYNRWMLVLKSSGEPVGTVGFHKWNRRNNRAEIGYDLDPSYWGLGLMFEAVRAAVRFGQEQMGLHRIEAQVAVENERSARLVEKLGFQREATLKDYYFYEGKYYDHWLYALVSG